MKAQTRIWDIPGGVHPPENKIQSNTTEIAQGPLPSTLVVPLQQHIGAPATPIVGVGDTVLKGQQIATASGSFSVAVHAPTSGTVTHIESRPVQHPSNIEGDCIVIQSDGNDTWCERKPLLSDDLSAQSPAAIRDFLQQMGIAGMGGAGFPTALKLNTPENSIEELIINAVECEPYITADDRLMRERADDIIAGITLLQHIVKPQRTLIGIEDNKPEAINALTQAIAKTGAGITIEIKVLPTKYPSGGEKQLIYGVTGKEVPSKGLPAHIGVVCQNIATAYAAYRAVFAGEPLISRITTVTGNAIKKPGNYDVLLGTPVEDLLAHAQADIAAMTRLIMGGPMMGFAIQNHAVPIVKVSNCILAPAQHELTDPALEQACIRCGSCEQVCPAHLLPQQLYWHTKAKDFDKAQDYNLQDCIECGACSYVCPSNIPLVQYYRFGKGQIRKNEAQAAQADQARERFEARQARLAREEAEKEAKRQARAAAAAEKQRKKKAEAAAKAKAASESGDTNTPDTPAKATVDNPLVALKSAAASASKRWKDAEKALATATKNAEDNTADEKQQMIREKLQDKVDKLKTKAEAANAAYAEAKKAQE